MKHLLEIFQKKVEENEGGAGKAQMGHTENTMTDLGMITLHVNGLNATVKRYRLSDHMKPNIGLEDSVFFFFWKTQYF